MILEEICSSTRTRPALSCVQSYNKFGSLLNNPWFCPQSVGRSTSTVKNSIAILWISLMATLTWVSLLSFKRVARNTAIELKNWSWSDTASMCSKLKIGLQQFRKKGVTQTPTLAKNGIGVNSRDSRLPKSLQPLGCSNSGKRGDSDSVSGKKQNGVDSDFRYRPYLISKFMFIVKLQTLVQTIHNFKLQPSRFHGPPWSGPSSSSLVTNYVTRGAWWSWWWKNWRHIDQTSLLVSGDWWGERTSEDNKVIGVSVGVDHSSRGNER